jgi:hypothetical protein
MSSTVQASRVTPPAAAAAASIAPAAAVATPISGRYEGEMSQPQPGKFALDLRIDIDSAVANSPVMNRVSGDIYQIFRTVLPGQPVRVARTYIESWIVDRPTVTPAGDHIKISGDVRFWNGVHAAMSVMIGIGWDDLQQTRVATAMFSETGGSQRGFACRRISDCFRNITLEMAVCQSVNAQPLCPSYDTSWHNNRPVNLPGRMLSIQAAYRETGVDVSISPNVPVVDDTAPQFRNWTIAELHDAMETHFSLFSGTWPNWALWGFMAGAYEESGVGGIMFDAAAAIGGAPGSQGPERRGFAVFRNHEWFNALVQGVPQNQAQAAAMRQFLYTWVHEAGHAFNFLHSWDKARPDSLSWMNYDWRYDQRNGSDAFWQRFAFRFDDDELIHLRHGNRSSVIMGGDPWSSGSHLEAPNLAMARIEGAAPLELVIRAQPRFDFMEPVLLEVRLRNLLPDAPVTVDKRLAPEYGGLVVFVQKPGDHIVKYDPVVCAIGTVQPMALTPAPADQSGTDRFSREIFLTYGADGFYFDEPGEYRIRAVYQGHGDLLVTSNTLRVRVGSPSQEADRLAQDYFSDQVGLSLYLQGSRSPYLKEGFDTLRDISDRFAGSLLGVKTATALANGLSQPFFRIEDPTSQKLVKTASADPGEALKVTEKPLDLLRNSTDRNLNLTYARVVRRRAEYHEDAGSVGQARTELSNLQRDLASRGANTHVIHGYAKLAENLRGSSGSDAPPSGARRRTAARRTRR